MTDKSRVSVDQLEAILLTEEEVPIEILPSGEVVARTSGTGRASDRVPLTFRENLGGEY